jgi:hypothetical protein
MTMTHPQLDAATAAHRDGRFEDAVSLLEQLFAEAERASSRHQSPYFMTMFSWEMLLDDYPSARNALQVMRDAQIAKLLAGDLHFDRADEMPKRRFDVIVEINDLIKDPASTCALFGHLDAADPALARKLAWRALPAVVTEEQWALSERYRGDPLVGLAECNALAPAMPLFPGPREAPRLAAALGNLVRAVHIAIATLNGLGRADDAAAVRAALLDGLEDDRLRALAERELAEPGTITREQVRHRMAQDDQAA